MAKGELFKDLKAKFYWSEAIILDPDGNCYEENQEFTGTKAYDMLCAVICEDKKAQHRQILLGGYDKTRIDVSYKDFDFDDFRVDLGDMEFGIHSNVTESLRTRLGGIIRRSGREDAEDALKEFNANMDEFAKDESVYLQDHKELQEKLNLEPISYLYCGSQKDWETVDPILHKFYVETALSVEDKMHFFSQNLPADPVFFRSTRRPNYRMKEYGETGLKLLIPKREQEMLNDFKANFSVSSVHNYYDTDGIFENSTSGLAALKFLDNRMQDDFRKFDEFKDGNYYVPEDHFDLSVKFHEKEIARISYDCGSGDCVRYMAETFSNLCKDNPEFKEQIITLCKYEQEYLYRVETLLEGLNSYEQENLSSPLPDKKTSEATLWGMDVKVPDDHSNYYDVYDYFNHYRKIALLNSSSVTDVYVNIAKHLANDGFTISTLKPILHLANLSSDINNRLLDAFRNDKEVKKIVKMNKKPKAVR